MDSPNTVNSSVNPPPTAAPVRPAHRQPPTHQPSHGHTAVYTRSPCKPKPPAYKPTFTTSSKPTFTTCSKPTFTTSSKPTFTTSSKPTFTTSSKPSFTTSSKPTFTTSSKPTFTTSSKPSFTTSSKPTFTTSSKPTFTTCSKPSFTTSSKPTFTTCSKPSFTTSSKPSFTTSSKPTFTTSSKPTFTTSSKPTFTTCSKPTFTTSSKPTFTTSSKPTFTTSSKPTFTTSSKPTFTTCSKPTFATCSKPTFAICSKPTLDRRVQVPVAMDTPPWVHCRDASNDIITGKVSSGAVPPACRPARSVSALKEAIADTGRKGSRHPPLVPTSKPLGFRSTQGGSGQLEVGGDKQLNSSSTPSTSPPTWNKPSVSKQNMIQQLGEEPIRDSTYITAGSTHPQRKPLPIMGVHPIKPMRPPYVDLQQYSTHGELTCNQGSPGQAIPTPPLPPPTEFPPPPPPFTEFPPPPPPFIVFPRLFDFPPPPVHTAFPAATFPLGELEECYDDVNINKDQIDKDMGAFDDTYEDIEQCWPEEHVARDKAIKEKHTKHLKKDEEAKELKKKMEKEKKKEAEREKEKKKEMEREKKEKKKEQERIEKEARKKFKLKGPVNVLRLVTVRSDYSGGKLTLAVERAETLEIIHTTANPDGLWLARNHRGHFGYVSINNIQQDSDIYDDVCDDSIYDND